jgi:hypothetical protein
VPVLRITNHSNQVRLVDWRDSRHALTFTRIAPGDTAEIGAGLRLAALERIIAHHENYGMVEAASLPLRPGFDGLAWSIEESTDAAD